MGHTEMLLAVAGLDKESLTERTRRLASGDWSSFPAADRYAFAFARKQAREPWSITAHDMHGLVEHFGRHRAIDVLWWACRCHYMTRVADAFQIPLETENVFGESTGEMGRAPAINGNAGRDHWGRAMSMMLAGGDIKAGELLSVTDEQRAEVIDGACEPEDVAATVLEVPGSTRARTTTHRSRWCATATPFRNCVVDQP